MQITAVPVNTPQLAARHSPHTIKVHQTDGDSIVVTYPSWLHLALRMGRWASGFSRVAIYLSKNRKRELLLNTTQCFASARTCSLMLRFTFNNDSYRCEKRKKKGSQLHVSNCSDNITSTRERRKTQTQMCAYR